MSGNTKNPNAKNPNAKNPNSRNGNAKNPNAKNPNAKNGNRKKSRGGNSKNNGNNTNNKNPNAKQSNKSGRNNKSGKSRGSSRKKRRDPMAFWGEMDQLPQPESFDTTPADTMALVTSLGDAPIPGQGSSSQHYFKLVYDRASGLAIALGHAGGLDDLTLAEDAAEVEGDADADDVDGNTVD